MKRYIKSSTLLFPYYFCGKYANGGTRLAFGDSEQECIEKLGNWQDRCGELLEYWGITDENYVDGELVR